MQRPRIAAFGITLAISSTALWAAPGDAYLGTYEDEDKVRRPSMEAAPLRPESNIQYDERTTLAPPAREELSPAPYDRAIEVPAQRTPHYDPRHPHTGQLIERGLFNRTGPNDFGA